MPNSVVSRLDRLIHWYIHRALNVQHRDLFRRLRGYHYSRLFAAAGPGLRLGNGVRITGLQNIAVGANVYIGPGVLINASYEEVTIGDHVLLAGGAKLITRQHGFVDPKVPIANQGYTHAPIVIEDDVWIGFNAIILPGVTVAQGSIIGAGAVVTKSIAPYHVVGGVPARTISVRNKEARQESPTNED